MNTYVWCPECRRFHTLEMVLKEVAEVAQRVGAPVASISDFLNYLKDCQAAGAKMTNVPLN